jgi:hypothetical protein
MSPTQRSLALFREQGAMVAVVERWNSFAKIRQDLFGFCDILAVVPGELGVTAIQACVVGDQSKRLAKIQSPKVREKARRWLEAQNKLVILGWGKKGKRGEPKVWTATERWLTEEDVG